MIKDTEKKLGNWIMSIMTEDVRKTFNKHNQFWKIIVLSICTQRDIINEHGDVNTQNVLDYIHNKLNCKKENSD